MFSDEGNRTHHADLTKHGQKNSGSQIEFFLSSRLWSESMLRARRKNSIWLFSQRPIHGRPTDLEGPGNCRWASAVSFHLLDLRRVDARLALIGTSRRFRGWAKVVPREEPNAAVLRT